MSTFDLEKAISVWRRSFEHRRALSSDDLEELERHLRDHVAWLEARGTPLREAFEQAARQVGEQGATEAEYRKVYWEKARRQGTLTSTFTRELAMLKNYVKIALRNVARHPGYSFINVFGLALGMAACLLILLFVQDELSYDRFHANAERIHRVVPGPKADGQPSNANGAFSWAPTLKEDFSEIEHAVRFRKMGWGEKRVVARGDQRFAEEHFFFADSTVFDVFTFPFVAGDPAGALDEPNTLVLTETMAAKYFGKEAPLGQVLQIDAYNDGQFNDYRVTGVLADVPANSHLQFDLLASFSSQTGQTEGWGFDPVFTYILLHKGADAAAVDARLPAFMERHAPDRWYGLHLQPLTDVRLRSDVRAELQPGGDIAYVYLFSAIAVFVLLLACINFMNLATARSAGRAKEVGVRKVLGAARGQLLRQFLGEAVLLSLGAAALALALAALLLPLLNAVADKSMGLGDLGVLPLLSGVLGLALLVGLLSGSYPAFFLSAFRPAGVLKGTGGEAGSGAARLRRGLVVFQFAVTIVLLACTAVVYQQMDFVRSKNLGFSRDQVVVLPLNDEIRQRYDAFRSALREGPGVFEATATEQVPGRAGNGGGYLIEGLDEEDGFTRLFVNETFAETYGIEMAAGRSFSTTRPTDAQQAYVVNEAFVREMGWASPEEAIGKQMQLLGWDERAAGHIIGVAKDFHLFSFRNGVPSTVLNVMPLPYLNFFSVRLNPAEARAALTHLEQTWAAFAPSYPFDFYFIDDDFAKLHEADARLGQVFQSFAFLALLVACLGLFGLAAFTAERRTKEIGIRKVLGASVPGVVALLSKEFANLVIVAFVVAVPVAYYAMSRWLENFAFRVELSWSLFLLAGLAALLIALLTVSYQAIRAALADPVDALRYE